MAGGRVQPCFTSALRWGSPEGSAALNHPGSGGEGAAGPLQPAGAQLSTARPRPARQPLARRRVPGPVPTALPL